MRAHASGLLETSWERYRIAEPVNDGRPGAAPAGAPPARPQPRPPTLMEAAPELAVLFRLDGKRALIVGGYGGIGQVTSEAFVAYGAEVAVAGRSVEKATQLAERLADGGARAIAARVDLADRASIEELVALVVEKLGGLEI